MATCPKCQTFNHPLVISRRQPPPVTPLELETNLREIFTITLKIRLLEATVPYDFCIILGLSYMRKLS